MATACSPCPSTPSDRQWSNLPALPLYSIASRLATLADFHAFSRVCRSWRSASRDARADFMSAQSPLVLCSADVHPDCDQTVDCSLYSIHDQRFYSPKLRLSSGGGGARCVGFSNGYLVMLDRSNRRPLLINPLTGAELRFPESPFPIDTAEVLRDRDGNPVLLSVMSSHCSFQCCRPGDPEWTVCHSPRCWVWCVAACGGKVYALVNEWRLATLDIFNSANPSITFLEAEPLPELMSLRGSASLAESGGELLTVVTVYGNKGWSLPPRAVEVFRLDNGAGAWVRTKTLKGSTLFLGSLLHSVSDNVSSAWGGAADCVYFTNFWRCSNSLFRLRMESGEVEDVSVLPAAASGSREGGAGDWSFCVWVLPRLCY